MPSRRVDRQPVTRALRFRRGLDLPIPGTPEPRIDPGPSVSQVAFVAADEPDLRPELLVEPGDRVGLGQALVADRERPGVLHTSPGSGRVTAIHRGPRQALQSVVVALDEDADGHGEVAPDDAGPALDPSRWRRADLVQRLQATGLWTALRSRPFGGVARSDQEPRALFVTAVDTRPLAPDPALVLADRQRSFVDGLAVLGELLDGPVFLCTAPAADIPSGDPRRITQVTVAGPHPAGLPGTHIHHLAPASATRPVWQVGYQDVVAIGLLIRTGQLSVERVVSLAGPHVRRPRLLRTRLGAQVGELLDGELEDGPCRVVSGSLLDGRRASGPLAFLGPRHLQLSVIPEIGPLREGRRRAWSHHSIRSRLGGWLGRAVFDTARHGPRGPALALPSLDGVMPLDIPPAALLRALFTGDDETVEALGGLDLVEEDLALCAHLCAGEHDWGRWLRRSLDRMARSD